MSILRRSRTRSLSSSNKQPKPPALQPAPTHSSTASNDSSKSSSSNHLSMAAIADMFIKLRHLQRRSKASNSIACSSGAKPLTHPHTRVNAQTQPKAFCMHADTYVCAGSGGVDAVPLLRATRTVLVQEASRIGATLAQERWSYVISQPKHRPNGQYKVHVQYSAALVDADCREVLQPVAMDKIRRIPGLMTVISRNGD
ncbi:hypothetical protein AGABI1DRAFT_93413 [Agaricus bisporus var. burnettii JB137-S8]|uniref:Uncharacterized protein n=2 Tax=Agaricus bisporus var. burnettii TaxID=192524 RepID=K5X331_AGABU|nr:uncharacterized protein AGABI1DRAFT_93413 [Agaricus bisporus var. burnettii JB137-S8]EKM77327.1 hypothetical protein AGABI1DRAFT_93413 [Agaricus bisporus var. burnettii JB137-S8]KAF7763554.1 hypothetical protein Agabi119p4_8091 [Agaricus bisporus var. burnettii]